MRVGSSKAFTATSVPRSKILWVFKGDFLDNKFILWLYSYLQFVSIWYQYVSLEFIATNLFERFGSHFHSHLWGGVWSAECFGVSIQVTSDTRSRASLDSPLQKPGRWFVAEMLSSVEDKRKINTRWQQMTGHVSSLAAVEDLAMAPLAQSIGSNCFKCCCDMNLIGREMNSTKNSWNDWIKSMNMVLISNSSSIYPDHMGEHHFLVCQAPQGQAASTSIHCGYIVIFVIDWSRAVSGACEVEVLKPEETIWNMIKLYTLYRDTYKCTYSTV